MSVSFRYKNTFIVEHKDQGRRLDQYVQEVMQGETSSLSRSKYQELIELGHILINKKTAKASSKLKDQDEVFIEIPQPRDEKLEGIDFPINILFEDEHCLVIHKPAGLVVHPAAGHEQDTLVNALLHKVRDLSVGFKETRPGIVHRLDKDTSGILVVAKTNQALENLSLQFKERTVHRIYHALVYGHSKKKKGTIQSFLERHPVHRKKFRSGSRGKHAVTHFKVLQESRGISLLQCKLETGRTHQIRVHLSENECPIVGDPIYSNPRRLKHLSKELVEEIRKLKGIGLHACELGFKHPVTSEELLFKEPWPNNLKPLIEMLGF